MENKPVSFEKVLYDAGMEKIQAAKADELFREQKSRQDSKFLSKISRVVIAAWDFAHLIAQLNPGETLTVNSEGHIFRGRVNTEKLKMLPEKLPGKNSLEFDTGTYEYIATKSWVAGYGNPVKNPWDKLQVKLAPSSDDHPLVAIFKEKVEEVLLRGKPEEITYAHSVTVMGHKFCEISIENFPIILGVNEATKKPRYIWAGGKRIDLM